LVSQKFFDRFFEKTNILITFYCQKSFLEFFKKKLFLDNNGQVEVYEVIEMQQIL
jgi:hypothetical protein